MPSSIEATLSEVELPVIDISIFAQDLDGEDLTLLRDHPTLAKLRKACNEWGFFLLINHGVPVDLLEKARNVGRDILSLPTEVKERASATGDVFDAYFRHLNFELIRLEDPTNPASIAKISAKICPEGSPIFSETMSAYVLSVLNLEKKITKMILASLGLDGNAFYNSHFGKCAAVLRTNGYPANNLFVGQEALASHADPGCLTILQQGDVGGLQIRSEEGEWFKVKPLPHSFVVNLGDSLKAWSNGCYRSAEHRVVYNGWRDRVSVGLFTFFPDETAVWAPVELVDNDNPRRYKPFTYSDLLEYRKMDKDNKDKSYFTGRIRGYIKTCWIQFHVEWNSN